MKQRKGIGFIVLLTLLALLASPCPASAVPPDFSGGVADEYNYQEMVFLSGQPLEFVGTIKVSEKAKADTSTATYNFTLTPKDSTITGKLTRKVSYLTTYDRQTNIGQTLSSTKVSNYSESVTISGDKYDLKDFQFSKSDAIDNRPASDYYNGNIQGRKTFTINKTQGTAVVDFNGGDVGFTNFWGNTETQIIDYNFNVQRTIPAAKGKTTGTDASWQGSAKVTVSDSLNKSLQYSDNQASLSSFTGSYTRVTREDMSSQYSYDLPVMNEKIPDDTERNQSDSALSLEKVPKVEKMIIPKFRDVGGHWAESSINQLYSLGVFEGSQQFFAPDASMTRLEFIRALVKACDIRANQSVTQKTSTASKKASALVSPFSDVPGTDPDYQYVKAAVDKGLASGESDYYFGADSALTRAQAVTMIIKALGFEDRAPTPGYSMSFADDDDIPDWARDSIYVAQANGLISGDDGRRINPNQDMTRAEASTMLVRFLNFLQSDLQKDYRENILLYS
ncbi:MAG TPA: S-layer homology domain-containing protein [Syntrophomonadaceae bacterium]|nr:S-layer homology domain-containing protein [Syntrophomonadaceae bacterium]